MVYSQDHKVVIAKLAALFPKAFFEEPKKRVPLKSAIVADVQKQGCDELMGFDVGTAIDFYMSHLGYQMSLRAPGKPRVDLNGKLVSKVTVQEAKAAQRKVDEIHEDMNARDLAAQGNPMHRVVNQGTDLMRKVTAPPLPNPRLELPPVELVNSITKKMARVANVLESEDDEFKAEFLEKVLREVRADVDAMLAKVR